MTEQSIVKPQSKIGLALWLLIFLPAVAWRAQNLDAFGPVNDEGAYLMWTRLAVDGYPLYTGTRAVQPPLFFEWLGLAFRLAGPTVQAGRWAILFWFAPLVAGLSWLAYRTGGWPAAWAALALLGLSPPMFTWSRLVMAESPATALVVVALVLLFIFLNRPHRLWLFASGLAFGLSLTVKALYPFLIVPLGLLLLRPAIDPAHPGRRWPELLLDGLVWGGGALLPPGLIFLFYDPVALYDQVVAFRGDLRAAIPHSWSETGSQFALFVQSQWGFWLLAFGGIMATVWRVRSRRNFEPDQPDEAADPNKSGLRPFSLYPVTWVVWLVSAGLGLAWHRPLFYQHLVVLLPPLILLGAGFLADVLALWRNGQKRGVTKIFLTMLVVAAVFNIPAMVKANQQTAAVVTGGREQEALALLATVSTPADFVMGDSQLLIFMAGRRTPPPLGDVALVAIKAGRQTSERMIGLNRDYQAPAVVQWSLRLPWLPDYLAWVQANYLARRVWDNDHIIYYAPRFPPDRPLPHERRVQLGDSLVWRGYQLAESAVPAGHPLSLKIYWQTDAPLDKDYTVFTQLLADNGTLVAGWDSQPLGGYFPTSRWPAGEIVTDLVRLPLPSDLPPGNYTLITGMYLLDTLERLPTRAGSDHIVVTTIKIN
ncbi:MAG: hypothetical protein AB1801_04770 [Chloroflexota bacterium]